MLFSEWIKDKDLNSPVSCCALGDPDFEDFQGKLGDIPVDKFEDREVIDPILTKDGMWIIDLF